MLPVREAKGKGGEIKREGRRIEREDRERVGQETWEIREMGLYLFKWECNTDTHTSSLRRLACLQLLLEVSLRSAIRQVRVSSSIFTLQPTSQPNLE